MARKERESSRQNKRTECGKDCSRRTNKNSDVKNCH